MFTGLDSSVQRPGGQEGPDGGQMCRRRTGPQPEHRTSPGQLHQGWEQELGWRGVDPKDNLTEVAKLHGRKALYITPSSLDSGEVEKDPGRVQHCGQEA